MIGLALAAALTVTPAERFFCGDSDRETLEQCVLRTRQFYCTPHPGLRWPSDDRIARHHAEKIRRANCPSTITDRRE
jgi:hypothetical protein